jgi:hypothetical protein
MVEPNETCEMGRFGDTVLSPVLSWHGGGFAKQTGRGPKAAVPAPNPERRTPATARLDGRLGQDATSSPAASMKDMDKPDKPVFFDLPAAILEVPAVLMDDPEPKADEIRQLSEQVEYEVTMTFALIDQLLGPRYWDQQVALNALIEAFTLHVRQLIGFLWPDRPREGDMLAADYFEPGEWERLRPKRPQVIDKALCDKIGWGVAHMTYGRARGTPEDKQWPFLRIGQALAPAVLCFLENVDQSKFDPGHYERMRDCVEAFQRWVRHRGEL